MIKNITLIVSIICFSTSCSKKTPVDEMPTTNMDMDTTVVDPVIDPMPRITEIARFPSEINECSGMINIDNKIISMNDGSSHTLLHRIDTASAEIIQTINVNQISNTDWEAIQHQSGYIYIADTGNNNGDRENLSLYTIPYTSSSELNCIDTINFIWPDQTDFTSSNFHPFDCESLLMNGNTAVFFSKNRSDFKTNVYRLNLTTEVITKGETINIGGLSTDVARDPSGDLILLSYLTLNGSTFVNKISILNDIDGVYSLKENINIPYNTQIEAIVHIEDHKYLLGAESESSEGGYLYSLDLSEFYQ